MDTVMPGIVGGIFLFAFRPGSTMLHDEIDFEFVTDVTQPEVVAARRKPNGGLSDRVPTSGRNGSFLF